MTKKVIAFVPIKLNSQRLPKKNLLPLLDKPLCWHIVDTLLKVKKVDKVYVYCSSNDIVNYIPSEAVYLQRDPKLDRDLTKGSEIYSAFINEIDADIYLLAHTTSPFISEETIDNALDKVLNEGYDSSFSAKKIQTFAWFAGNPLNYSFTDVPRTQEIEPIMVETSGFYMFKKEIFTIQGRRIGFNPYIQEVNDLEAIDIDTADDYELALCVEKMRR